MPRPCTVCSSSSRARLESALSEGATFAAVSRESRFSELSADAIQRHWSNHVAPEVRSARWAEGVSAMSIAERMMQLATEAMCIRKQALADGNGRLALQAVKTESDLMSKLVDRLGITPDTSEDALAEVDAMVKLVAQIARRSPRVGEWVADQLPPERLQLAEAIRGVARASVASTLTV